MHPSTAIVTHRLHGAELAHPPQGATPCSRRSVCAAFALLASAGGLAGCGMFSKAPPPPPVAPPKPSTLSINIVTSASINPDARKRPSPVVVRVYELKSAAQFDSADFVSLYEKDQALLGADIVVRDEFVLQPGETKTINKLLAADTKFIGVMAAFRELERARWRGLVALVPGKNNAVTVSLDGIAVQAAVKVT
jgi:type VI secretion system protein VasD